MKPKSSEAEVSKETKLSPAPVPPAPEPAPAEQTPAISPQETPASVSGTAEELPVEPTAEPKPSAPAAGSPGEAGYGGPAAKATASSATYKPSGGGPRLPITDEFKAYSWYYMKQPKGYVPNFPNETRQYTDNMKALWVGTGKKVYLTIDTGGPMGDTELLVKSLKDNNAKANFFIAGYNVKKNPDFVRTLVADGHLVANHTMTHTDMNLQTDEQVIKEIQDYESLYREVTGKEIQPYFRFPYGRYNMHLLNLVSDMGYSSVFWSTAMKDWVPRANGAEDPYNDIMGNLHDGNIVLIHQGSPENIEALDRIIKGIRDAGYELALLTDIQPPGR
ncbi:polysaccharide deacetylase family protein [Paenibacillus sp. S3N08]|uniref:Polysaccharide deacetylase family protein n=2 Tax=Paenibacillus agricola TaxID=2716264 RepID=A0ABX0J7P7_9BACL|nr:polysaccharide deacetylase family protein [Paenibacillus agricola]